MDFRSAALVIFRIEKIRIRQFRADFRNIHVSPSEKSIPFLGPRLTVQATRRYNSSMRPPAFLPLFASALILTAFSPHLRAQIPEPNSSEMQERANRVILTRALPLMEQAARAADMSPAQAAQVELLLKEQRRIMTLFLSYSGLAGDNLQAKLLEVLDTTRNQLEATKTPGLP